MVKQTLPGIEDQEIPAELQEAAEQYVTKLKARQRTQEKENELRQKTIELMKKHGVRAIELDDERKLVLESKGERIKITKIQEPNPSSDDSDMDDDE